MNETDDIYPLGQGKGLLSDVLNFALNNFYQAGQKAKASNVKRGKLFDGSGDSSIIQGLIEEAADINPVGGVLGPIGRSGIKGIDQAQKKIVKSLFRGDPAILKEVVESPRKMNVKLPGGHIKRTPSNSGIIDAIMHDAFAHFDPGSSSIRIEPDVLRGKFKGTAMKEKGIEGLPDIAIHEATHFLNEPEFRRMIKIPTSYKADKFRFVDSLRPFIGHTKYGKNVLDTEISNPIKALNEGLSYLAQPTGRSPAATWLNDILTGRKGEGGISQFDKNTQNLLMEALNASKRVPGSRRLPTTSPMNSLMDDVIKSSTPTNPRNPRDIQWTPQQQAEYNKLPQAGRSQQVPEDARRRMLGEQAGPQLDLVPRGSPSGQSAGDSYKLWQELAKILGVPVM